MLMARVSRKRYTQNPVMDRTTLKGIMIPPQKLNANPVL